MSDAAASTDPPPTADVVLYRRGASRESVARLARKAAEAEARIGIHGVSVSATPPAPHEVVSAARRADVERHFRVHDTPSRGGGDPLHKTVELPKPVTQADADRFNQVFGRG